MRSLALAALVGLCAPIVSAEERYFLKFEESGYDRLAAEQEIPKAELLRSFELLVRPDEQFKLRLEAADGVVQLVGRLQIENGKFSLEWSPDASKDLAAAEAPSDPEVNDLRQKRRAIETDLAKAKMLLQYSRSAAKSPDSDPAVIRFAESVRTLQSAADQVRRDLLKRLPEDKVSVVDLELEKPTVIRSLTGEQAKGNGLWQKSRRTTAITLRSTSTHTVTIQLPHKANSRDSDAIEKGMILDALEHERRIQRHQLHGPDLYESLDSIELKPDVRQLLPATPRE